MIGGYYLSQAIYVAARLGIADRLRDGPQNAGQLAQATGAHARSLHRLLRTLAGFGIFAEEAGRFQLTELAELLRSDVPGSLRAQAFTVGETHYPAFGELLHSVETGRPGFDRAFGMPLFDYFAANQDAAQTFDSPARTPPRPGSSSSATSPACPSRRPRSWPASRAQALMNTGLTRGPGCTASYAARPAARSRDIIPFFLDKHPSDGALLCGEA